MSTQKKSVTWGRGLETLGSEFLQDMLNNMVSGDAVRLGQKGQKAIRPNYQVTRINNENTAFDGNSHKEDSEVDTYNSDWLSIPFSYQEVRNAIENAKVLNWQKPIGK